MALQNQRTAILALLVAICGTAASAATQRALHDGWRFRQGNSEIWHPAHVPGNTHLDLMRERIIDDPFFRLNERSVQWVDKEDWMYETHFTPTAEELAAVHQAIVFEGLDTYADVYLNHQRLIEADNMHRTWRSDVRGILHEGDNLLQGSFSVRWRGKLRPVISGRYQFCFTAAGGGERLFVDGQKVIDQWWNHPVENGIGEVELVAGREYDLQAEYFYDRDFSMARLQWRVPESEKATRLELYGDAGRAVRECDVVVAVMGTNKTIEREGQDRERIDLPADQQEFLQEIQKLNPNIVLVLVAGSQLALNWEDKTLPAIVNAWYPGEQGGRAVADVLFGDYNPSGRLPLTYYSTLDELPPFGDYDLSKGRTYQYFQGHAIYPFGYGLSYTRFSIGRATLNGRHLLVPVRNTGRREGTETIQLYLRSLDDPTAPLKVLRGFTRLTLRPGERQTASFELTDKTFERFDEASGTMRPLPGRYQLLYGTSSADKDLQSIDYTFIP